MAPDPGRAGGPNLVCVDAGTTNTRAWLVDGERILARREAAVGARDTARDGHDGTLRAGVRRLIADLLDGAASGAPAPRRVAAAGMITSPQGLCEVPHLVAPAGVAELAAGAQERLMPDVCGLPFVFVPGVRTTALPGVSSGIGATDVMRGEETLCVGLLRQGRLAAGGALLNVGSHWKLIRIDDRGRLAWSVTSLAGEMVQVVRSQTILASAFPGGPLAEPDVPRLLDGMTEARRSGLSRALFCVRLLQLSGTITPEGRLSFLVGAFIGADLDRLLANGSLPPGTPITISGGEKVGGAWSVALEQLGCPVRSLAAVEVEAGFVAGLCAVMEARTGAADGRGAGNPGEAT
jgi:2-dehydro-3-deoxygalactonokinase